MSCELCSWHQENELPSPERGSKHSTTVPTNRREELQISENHGHKD